MYNVHCQSAKQMGFACCTASFQGQQVLGITQNTEIEIGTLFDTETRGIDEKAVSLTGGQQDMATNESALVLPGSENDTLCEGGNGRRVILKPD
jgi:hypothetical protein